MTTQNNAKKTAATCMMCNGPEEDDYQMVSCSGCKLWSHSSCAEVGAELTDAEWYCSKCTKNRDALLRVPKTRRGSKKATAQGDAESVRSGGSSVAKHVEQLEEELLAKEEAMLEQMEIRAKRLEMTKRLAEMQLRLEKEMRERELQLEREMQDLQLKQEQELLDNQLAAEREFCKKRDAIRQKMNASLLKVKKLTDEGTAGGVMPSGSADKSEEKVKKWLQNETNNQSKGDFRGAYPKGKLPIREHQDDQEFANGNDDENRPKDEDGNEPEPSIAASKNGKPDGPGQQMVRVTNEQLAARQAISKHLPTFKGEPEIWPLFISSFEYTTEACGFSNIDNLKRLQDSLQGDALEAVRSRLVLPNSVPDVIRDLRNLFGKPEKLLKTLMMKVRNAPAPRIDRLESFIHFGITVKQLCDHLEAAELNDHLSNPMLVQELVEKLPPSYKMDWVRFKRGKGEAPLRIFTDFMTDIVSDVSEVSDVSFWSRNEPAFPGKNKSRKKEFVHLHDSATKRSEEMPSTNASKPCWICKRTDHKIRFCDDFKRMNVAERWKAVDKMKLCGLCLNNHGNSRCNFKLRCTVKDCGGNHHYLLHRREESVQLMEVSCNADRNLSRGVIFRMVPVTLCVGKLSLNTMAFLDEGSSSTLVEEAIANRLNVKGEAEPLIVTWTGDIKRHENESRKVKLMLTAMDSNEKFVLENVRTVSKLVLPKQTVRFAEIAARYPHLAGLPVADHTSEEPTILIGLDNLHLFAPLESRVGKPGEPIAVRSTLGWTVYGPETRRSSTETFLNLHVTEPASNQKLHDMLRDQYVLDEAGITSFGVPESVEDQRARAILQATTSRDGNRFQTGLLWLEDERQFPDSYPMAMRRLKALERKLEKNPKLKENVCQQIEDYQIKGYAHLATAEELAETPLSAAWYLPLNVVLKPRKPDKVRLVWDAAASVNGVSLNSKLMKGPDMLVALPAVISRFREKPVAFGGDIAEMYHQVGVRPEDKQALRFLFRSNPDETPRVYVMDVLTFGATCSPCSAQFVKNLNASQFAEEFPEAADAVIHRHYVDDYYDSTDTVEEAIGRAKEVQYIHAQGGFQIRNWVANSDAFLEELGERNASTTVHFDRDKNTEYERVLGIVWKPKQDVFSFNTSSNVGLQELIQSGERPTKRKVLSCVMALFDPLGLLSPFTVLGKMLVQDIWRTGCEWDDCIDDVSFQKWMRWLKLLSDIEMFKVPRCYFGNAKSGEIEDLQLHIFTDASETAYGCVAFFRAVIRGEVTCALVMSRSKVAPLKQLSIPRLELQAAVLGARMAQTVRESHSLQISRQFFWTDSQTVLSWIRSDQRRYKQFVGFRIGEILGLTKITEWCWVPTKLNVADQLTKWGNDLDLGADSSWVRGPTFLYQKGEEWPMKKLPPANTTEELRVHLLLHDAIVPEVLIDVRRFSKWTVLVRTMASVYRFVANCKKKSKGLPIEVLKATNEQVQMSSKFTVQSIRVPLQQEEYSKAERLLLKMAQAEAYKDELKVLVRNKESPTNQWLSIEKSSPLYKLTPLIEDDCLIRMEGRAAYAEFLPFELRFPVIVPDDHPIAKLIVQHYHEKFGHGYRETVKNEIKHRFHIPKINAVIRKVSSSCVWCRVHRNRPQAPRMAPLPVQRLTPNLRPFSYVGVDYLGPFEVTVGRRKEKRWIVLFTCLVVRAVHVEVAYGLTTQACLMAIRRFVCRRGPPCEFFSDNGTNLRGASREIVGITRSIGLDCAEEFTNARTKWSFNPPSAPHMGGVWERLVRSIKEALDALNDGRRLTDEILQTSIVEAEDMLNSRPLTYVSQESSEAETLTPNHFLRGVSPNEPHATPASTNTAEALRDSYRRSQQLADDMWKRWIKEYIPSVNQRTKWFEESKLLKAGDLVFVVEGSNRKSWVRGIVEEPIISGDGRTRQAWVRTRNGVFKRPAVKLAVLEIAGNTVPGSTSGPELRAGEMFGTTPMAPLPSDGTDGI